MGTGAPVTALEGDVTRARNLMLNFAAAIDEVRVTRGLTWAAVGREVGIDKVHMSYLSRGRWIPPVEQADALLEWLAR